MMETVSWGIIGPGDVCEVKSAPAMQKLQQSRIVAVMRRDVARAQDFAARHGVAKVHQDAQALIEDPDVTAVYVATPPHLHADFACRAAAASKPVYVEKPMANSHAECRRMIAACAEAGVPLFVAYYRRALPQFLKVAELLAAGAIGTVRTAELVLFQSPGARTVSHIGTPWRFDPAIGRGGLIADLGSHQLDLLDFLLGPIDKVTGLAGKQSGRHLTEDVATANFSFASGVVGTALWCFSAAPESDTDRLVLTGSAGQLTVPVFGPPVVTLDTARGTDRFSFPQPDHIQMPLIAQVVASLRGTGHCVSTGETAARTNRVLDAILGQ